MILQLNTKHLYPKWEPFGNVLDYFNHYHSYWSHIIDEIGGTISAPKHNQIMIVVPDEESWRLDRWYWLPLNCTHDYKPITRCSQTHYTNLHKIWEEYPNIIFKPSGLPDLHNELEYYIVRRPLCGNCEIEIGPPELTGPASSIFGI